jgi:hypothetical protein
MTDHSVITGSFSEFKTIKTRSVIQVVIEVPIEHADLALATLGGVPQPGKEVPVAVARLQVQAAEPKPARKGSLAQQAGIRCGEPAFLKFLTEEFVESDEIAEAPQNDFDAAALVRIITDVESRAEFDSDPAAGQRWKDLEGRYRAWLRV